ncbi:DUF2590 family protein [Endozoicomonas montiporae]|uniref:Phage protein n=1 Tax=Endozoicomonas montiporae CL-33 TaxID=570277 RepID=A0A142BCS7_9GAMM|nr:DUF2590 family protein [Endozoicomonas montiporae]AMO56553.1 hypothetical protein EZMO1_2469 [Endozoicomonas montiporae CL-33]
MSEQQWIDILIKDRDIALDVAGMPAYTDDRASIAQDIKHMILETGILIELVADRSRENWLNNMNRLELMVEEDVRIVPGTVKIERPRTEVINLTANTTMGPILWPFTLEEINAYQ